MDDKNFSLKRMWNAICCMLKQMLNMHKQRAVRPSRHSGPASGRKSSIVLRWHSMVPPSSYAPYIIPSLGLVRGYNPRDDPDE